MKYYVVNVQGGVEPGIVAGPFQSIKTLEAGLVKYLKNGDYKHEEDGLFGLDITKNGTPKMWAWEGGFMDEMRAKAGLEGV